MNSSIGASLCVAPLTTVTLLYCVVMFCIVKKGGAGYVIRYYLGVRYCSTIAIT